MKPNQYGFTMIELLVSMVLGLSLIAGVSVMFTNSQRIYKTQRSMGYMMEDGRYMLETFSKELRRTAFLRNRTAANGDALSVFRADTGSTAVPSTVDGVLGSNISIGVGEYVRGVSVSTTATDANDAFVIRYQLNDQLDIYPNNSNSPCSQNLGLLTNVAGAFLENPSIDVHVVSVYFFVANDSDGVPVLYCRAKREQITPGAIPDTTKCNGIAKANNSTYGNCLQPDALPLISNVERLIVRYGIDTDAVADGAANYYAPMGTLAATDWQRVVSVKLFVVLRTDEDNIAKSAGKFSIEGTACSGTTGIMRCPDTSSRRIYKVFSTTVALRNVVS